jgi:hypothetical protein
MPHSLHSALWRAVFGFSVLLVTLGFGPRAMAQAPLGQWQLIATGASAVQMVEAQGALYVIGGGGLYRYDLDDSSVRLLSKQDGLAGVDVAALAYDVTTGLVVIGYRDTNIDLLDPRTNTISNIADIQRRAIIGEKTITSIYSFESKAFVACSFGIVVVDLKRLEVADTYANLGRNGETISISAIAVNRDSVVASTYAGGLLVGLRTRNLLDYRNWSVVPFSENASSITVFQGCFFFLRDYLGLCSLRNGVAQFLPGLADLSPPDSLVFGGSSLSAAHNLLTIVQPKKTFFSVIRPDLSKSDVTLPGVKKIKQILAGSGGRFFLANPGQGLLITDDAGAAPVIISPNGPTYDITWNTFSFGSDVYGLSGGIESRTPGLSRRVGFSRRRNGRWESFNKQTVPDSAKFPIGFDVDLVAGAGNPINNKIYLASYGDGLIEWDENGFRRFDVLNSPLIASLDLVGFTRVLGVAVDNAGVVWVTNFHQQATKPSLFSFDPVKSEWKSHLAGALGVEAAEKIVIDDNGFKWVSMFPTRTVNGTLIAIYNEKTGANRLLTTAPNSGGLLGPVYSMAKDRKGDMWIGTSKGVQVFYNTASVLDLTTAVTARQPIIDRRPLLDNQIVKVIAVDGGNRKWIGTSDGLFLFNEDGDKTLAHYTAENSPLPSNSVISLSINGVTGEIFVGTDNGLVALRMDATEPSSATKPTCANVFPNPVPARFADYDRRFDERCNR